MKRVFHRYEACEEFRAGMWSDPPLDQKQGFIDAASRLMRNPSDFKKQMERAAIAWPNSFENSLTSPAINGIAFLGHCGCCIGTGSPEHLTRLAWHTLNQKEQDEANSVAGEVLKDWTTKQEAKESCQSDMWKLMF